MKMLHNAIRSSLELFCNIKMADLTAWFQGYCIFYTYHFLQRIQVSRHLPTSAPDDGNRLFRQYLSSWFIKHSCLSFPLQVEAAGSSAALVPVYPTSRRHYRPSGRQFKLPLIRSVLR